MTNYIKKIMTVLAFGMVMVTPTLAQATEMPKTECARGNFNDMKDEITKAGVTITTISLEEKAAIVQNKGNPPGIDADAALDTFEFLLLNGEQGQQLVVTTS